MKNLVTEKQIKDRKTAGFLPPVGVVIVFAALAVAVAGSLWSTLVVLVILTGILIFAEKKGYVDTAYERIERNRKKTLLTLAVCLFLFPLVLKGNSYFLHIIVMAGIYAIVALGLNLQIGSMGQVNFAPAAMFGVGAYTSAMLSVRYGASPWIGLLAAMVVTAGMGIVFGFPALKTRGFYFSLVTIALQTIFTLLVVNIDWLGGPNGIPGIPPISIFGWSLKKSGILFGTRIPYQIYYIYLIFLLLMVLLVVARRLYMSRIGLAWNAIEEDEIVAATQGINLTRVKLLSFSIGSVFAGIAGSIYAHYTSFIGVEDFDFNKSLVFICMVLLGGMDNPVGVTVGAVILTMIDEKLRIYADYRMLMYSVILIIVLIVRSQGLLPRRYRNYSVGEEK